MQLNSSQEISIYIFFKQLIFTIIYSNYKIAEKNGYIYNFCLKGEIKELTKFYGNDKIFDKNIDRKEKIKRMKKKTFNNTDAFAHF